MRLSCLAAPNLMFPFRSPADFILDCISVDYRSSDLEQSTEVRVARILAAWKNRAANSKADATHRAAIADVDRSRKILSAPFFTAFPVVLARSFKCVFRRSCGGVVLVS